MKALVFSDSHGKMDYLLEALKCHPDYEAIFHLGDVLEDAERIRRITPYPVYMVKGNCDYSTKLKETLTVDFGGKRIAMCHGHRYLGFRGGTESLRYFGLQEKADIVMFGHTHIPLLEKTEDIILLNPGSISQPRQENKIPTYTVMDISADGNVSFEMCEIEKRFRPSFFKRRP